MDVSKILSQVCAFASRAHGEQTRKYTNEPYIYHPIRVMDVCKAYTTLLPTQAAALLHDVLEDTPTTLIEINDFLSSRMAADDRERTCKLVVELTDVYTRENFPSMNRRLRKMKEAERLWQVSAEAQTIKYADILDNTDVCRNDPDFAVVFLREARQFLSGMKLGNPDLRLKVVAEVEKCLQSLGVAPLR